MSTHTAFYSLPRSGRSTRPTDILAATLIAVTLTTLTAALCAPAIATADDCPNATIRAQQGSTYLAGCGAYELVSPPNTNGIGVGGFALSLTGDRAWIGGFLPVLPDQVSGNTSLYLADRSEAGWQSHDLADPNEPGPLATQPALPSRDSTATITSRCELRAVVCFGPTWIDRVTHDGQRTPMLKTIPSKPLGAPTPDVVDGTADLSRIIVQTSDGEPGLLPEDTHARGRGLYRADLGSLEYLGIDEHGDVLECGAALASNAPALDVGAGLEQNGISRDAGTVIFASPDPVEVGFGNCLGPVDLYVRRGGQTVNISAPRIPGVLDRDATYVGNTRDGDTVYFVTASQLVADDTDNVTDIYAYDLSSDTQRPLTRGADISATFGRPSVQVSTEGTFVYFVSTNAIDGQGSDGAQNLFRYHDGVTSLIASTTGFVALGQPLRSSFPSPLTPDGRHLLFFSDAPLTGQAAVGGSFQLFRYSAESETLSCISCPSDGSDPGSAPLLGASDVWSRSQSDDGSTVAFATEETLIGRDINNELDVYMWREGALSLVSSGRSLAPSRLRGMSSDGRSVLFDTVERLTDETSQQHAPKVYVARFGGGFERLASRPGCVGDECQGLVSSLPLAAGVPSASLRGSGNLGVPRPTRLLLSKISASQRERLARTGRIALAVQTNRGGRLSVRLSALLGGRWRVVARNVIRQSKAGRGRVTLRLSKGAREYLERDRKLRIRISAGHSAGATGRMRLTLRRAGRRGGL
jgi:hypothetical protein